MDSIDLTLSLDTSLSVLSLEQIIELKLRRDLDTDGAPDNGLWQWALAALERPLVRLVHERCHRNQVHTALVLNLNRNTARKYLARHGLIGTPQEVPQ